MRNARTFCAALLGCAFLMSSSSAGSAGAGVVQKKVKPPTATMTSPRAGSIFFPGDRVTVTWDVKPGNIFYCEQELYLLLDGGKEWARITYTLGPEDRVFEWTVPDMPTDNAMLQINLGCDQRPFTSFEGVYVQTQAPFQILPARHGYQSIKSVSVDKPAAKPGDEVTVKWDSSIEDLEGFEVKVSYDRGANFHSIGNTRDTSFKWTVPEDFSGTLAFSVAARKLNGARVEASPGSGSLIDIKRQQ